jgi:hypothetical protein
MLYRLRDDERRMKLKNLRKNCIPHRQTIKASVIVPSIKKKKSDLKRSPRKMSNMGNEFKKRNTQ